MAVPRGVLSPVLRSVLGGVFPRVGGAAASDAIAAILNAGIDVFAQPITFARASAARDLFDASEVASGTLRSRDAALFTGSSATLKQVTVEPSSTNKVTDSEDFSAAGWALDDATISSDAVVGPLGVSADKLVEAATTSRHIVFDTISATAGQKTAVSVYAKAAGRDHIALTLQRGIQGDNCGAEFDLTNGTVNRTHIGVNGTVIHETGIEAVGDGWYRCWMVASDSDQILQYFIIGTSDGTTAFGNSSDISYLGDGSSGVYISGAQYEAPIDHPTSYIATSGATATRAADTISAIDVSGFAGGGIGDDGTLMVVAIPVGWSGTPSASAAALLKTTAASPELAFELQFTGTDDELEFQRGDGSTADGGTAALGTSPAHATPRIFFADVVAGTSVKVFEGNTERVSDVTTVTDPMTLITELAVDAAVSLAISAVWISSNLSSDDRQTLVDALSVTAGFVL